MAAKLLSIIGTWPRQFTRKLRSITRFDIATDLGGKRRDWSNFKHGGAPAHSLLVLIKRLV